MKGSCNNPTQTSFVTICQLFARSQCDYSTGTRTPQFPGLQICSNPAPTLSSLRAVSVCPCVFVSIRMLECLHMCTCSHQAAAFHSSEGRGFAQLGANQTEVYCSPGVQAGRAAEQEQEPAKQKYWPTFFSPPGGRHVSFYGNLCFLFCQAY